MNKKKRVYKSNGVKVASAADTLETSDIDKLKAYLLSLDLSKPNNLRNYALFVFNLNVGLRAKDLLSLPKDLLIKDNRVVNRFAIYESKTGKKRIIELNKTAKGVIERYYQAFKKQIDDSNFLFPSRKKNQGEGHLTLSSYDKILKVCQREAGVDEVYTVSSHSARKCLGTALYEHGVPIEQIQQMFGHSKPETTLIYISVQKKWARKLYHQVEL